MITVVVSAAAVVGASTYFSFRYWEREILAAGEQQVLLAANSARATLESTLPFGRFEQARGALHRLLRGTSVTSARVHGGDGLVLLSVDPTEEGERYGGIWIPSANELPSDGITRTDPPGDVVRAYLPLSLPESAVLELELSVAPLRSALVQGSRLGVGLMIASVLALGLILIAMLEREVVMPLQRMEGALASEDGTVRRGRGEVRELEASVARIIEREKEAVEHAALQERRLAEQAGFAEVGEMASEMAHEFKRPLAAIRTAIELLEQEYVLEGTGRDVLTAVDGQLDRLKDTMQDLFSLARPVLLERSPVSLSDAIDDALLEAVQLPVAHGIHVHRLYRNEKVIVPGDARRLGQAFGNLVVNALEAMSEGGELTIAFDRSDPEMPEVVFTDTGPGIAQSEIDRAVRPFYSTKPLGTGLGLPLVARVVAAHGGRLSLESAIGSGTTVRVALPVRTPDPETGQESWHPNGS
jgi:signal transduction histidine kinase